MSKAKNAGATNTAENGSKHRTSALNLTQVPNYPKKLVIYQLAASPFWWVRYYADGKILRRSTKETDKRRALAFAKDFYDEVNYRQRQGYVLNSRAGFEQCANAVIEQQDAKVQRKEMSEMMQQNDKYRLRKEVLPFFGKYDLKSIDYFVIENFINKLGNDKLTPPTISNYVGLVRKVLSYAQRKGYIEVVPQFPKVKKVDAPRGWFTTREYKQVWSAARAMVGETWEIRKWVNEDGEDETFCCERTGVQPKRATKLSKKIAASKLLKRVEMTADLYNLIVFMSNSFIRPTDIKWMQHKHVEIIDGEHKYLRLSLPTSKKHDKPIVTMRNAVDYYVRQRDLYYSEVSKNNLAKAEDYVFLPKFGAKKREDALTALQRQFAVVLHKTGLTKGSRGEKRSLYSLRHTCIMYRLLYGEGLDLLTLARNARTSPEMIDRFYASHLQGEMNVGLIQSKRKRVRKSSVAKEVVKN
jgi:hypothetical protein